MERFTNNAFTTLAGAIDESTTPVTFAVASASAFPTAGNFRIVVDSEILLVTSVSGNNFTATRGAEGSPIQAHAVGAGVRHVFTAGVLTQVLADNITTGPYASLPSSAGRAGRMYVPTDEYVVMVSDGSNWLRYGPIYPVTRPNFSGATQVNFSGTTYSQTAFGAQIVQVGGAGGTRRGVFKSTITAPYKITMIYSQTGSLPGDTRTAGLAIRDSATGKLVTFEIAMAFGACGVHQWNSPTSFNNSPLGWGSIEYTAGWIKFLQIHDDGTNHRFNFSADGIYWDTLYTQSKTAWLATPDQYGFIVGEGSATTNVLSFKEESA
jgi:hypothetical protein